MAQQYTCNEQRNRYTVNICKQEGSILSKPHSYTKVWPDVITGEWLGRDSEEFTSLNAPSLSTPANHK